MNLEEHKQIRKMLDATPTEQITTSQFTKIVQSVFPDFIPQQFEDKLPKEEAGNTTVS
jgi:hypothetical protein